MYSHTMPARKRILAALRGGQVDRTPLTVYAPDEHYAMLYPDYPASGPDLALKRLTFEIAIAREIGLDYVKFCCPPYYETKYGRVKVEIIEQDGTRITAYRTPIGTVRSVEEKPSVHGLPVFRKHLLASPEDFRIYEYVCADREFVMTFETAGQFLRTVGDDGVLLAGGPSPPLKEMLLFLAGIAGCAYSMTDYPRVFDSLERVMHRKNLEACRMMAEAPLQVFMDMGVSGTNMISPRMFNDYCVRQSHEYADRLHSRGKLYCCLVAGEAIGAILDGLKDAGVDAIWDHNPNVPGNPTIPELLEVWDNRICVAGGLDIVALSRCRPEEAARMAAGALRGVQAGDRFMLAGTGLLVSGTPMENLKAVARMVTATLHPPPLTTYP